MKWCICLCQKGSTKFLPMAFTLLCHDLIADETKIVLHQTIDSVLRRGEKLDNLVDKSNDLSLASQMFYKQAKRSNSCCSYW